MLRAPNRVNRAHWPTKENSQKLQIFCIFPAHAKNWPRWPQMGPGVFFPTNPDLADILGDMDFDFENCCFWIPLYPKFQDFQVADFQKSGLGPGWAPRLGRGV